MAIGQEINSKDGNLKSSIYKGTIWALVDNFSRQGITFVVFIILARYIEPAVFGLLSVSLVIIQLFRSVIYDSIATAIVRKMNPDHHDYDTGFWLCILFSVPAFLLLFFLSGYIEYWTGTKHLGSVIRGISVVLLTAGIVRMHEAWLTHNMQFKSLAIRSTISVLIGGIAGAILAYKGYGIESVVTQQLVMSFTELIMLWIVTPWRPGFYFSKKAAREIFSYSRHVAATGLTNFANQNSDVFFVTYFLGAKSTGIYSTGKRITNTLNAVISSALLRVSLPAFSKMQNDEKNLQDAYLHSTALTAIVTAPLFVGLAMLSKDITMLMLGKKWIDSAVVMQIVTIVGFLTSIGYYNQSIMLVKNKPEWQTRLTFLYAFTNLFAFYVFVRYGLIYTAWAFTLRALFLYPVSVWCAIKLLSLKASIYIKGLLPALSASAIMAAVIYLFTLSTEFWPILLRFVVSIILGVIVYSVFCYIFLPKFYKIFLNDKLRNVPFLSKIYGRQN